MDLTDLSALMGEDLTTDNYADLWVVLPDPAATPLLGEARRIADGLGCYVHCVVPNPELATHALSYGADRVHVAENVVALLAAKKPEFAFFPTSLSAQAAQLAQQLRAGLITAARNLSVDDNTRALRAAHPVYGGDYLIEGFINTPAKIVTLDPRQWPLPFADDRSGEVVEDEVPSLETRLHDLGPVDYTAQAWRPLTKAKVIVAVGRGLKDEAGVNLAKELAVKLGAEFGGDRSARDSGWIDDAHEVGLTGVEVTPDLYLALGIVGDTIHNVGIVNAKRVIAVHSNPAAPIFSVADEAVVADPREFVEKLLAQLN